MIWEVKRGRSCDSLRLVQVKLIEVQGRELVATSKALQLSESRSSTADLMIDNLKDQVSIERELAVNQNKKSKVKLRNRTLIILGEALVIVLFIVL